MSFLEEIEGSLFENYQVNGTKYLKNSRQLPLNIADELAQCAGEIYLNKIPEGVTAEQIVSVASLLGELYVLRFKLNFAGQSRGFAYLQYTNPGLMNLAIQRLPGLFKINGMGQIKARPSKNSSNLVLRNVHDMTPQMVEQTLRAYVNFRQVYVHTDNAGRLEYQIVFKANEEAVQARRILIGNIQAFGSSATVTWDRVVVRSSGSGRRC